MASPVPSQVSDPFNLIGGYVDQAVEFINPSPSAIGYGTRQSRLPNNRTAIDVKHTVKWLIPEGPIVEMYVNPNQIRTPYQKDITKVRTKGGYVLQYWGPQLTVLNISGTTATSGIEGINVLYDIYNAEQNAFDAFALYMAANNQQEVLSAATAGEPSALESPEQFVTALLGGSQNNFNLAAQETPNLAQLAFSVEMYYSGKVFRGYFTSFTVEENATNVGMFDYSFEFVVTQERGFRQNFLAWHRSATSGPVNPDAQNGTPFSFAYLLEQP